MPVLKLLLTNTKEPRSTKALVSGVLELQRRLPSVVDPIMNSIEAVVQEAVRVLTSSDATLAQVESGLCVC